MASYHVIGGDTKEYGPIWEADIRTWIAEGRLNGQSLAKAEGETGWRTLASFPEFAEALRTAPVSSALPPPFATGMVASAVSTDYVGRDYELDIGGCVTRGWELLKNNFGTVFPGFLAAVAIVFVAYCVAGTLASLVLPQQSVVWREVGRLVCAVIVASVAGPMMGGFYLLIIRLARNETVTVGDAFAGFQRSYKDLFLGQMIMALLLGLLAAPYTMINDAKLIPILDQLRQSSEHSSAPDVQGLMQQMSAAMFASLPVMLVCMIPLTYLAVNLQFTLPLIIDKQMAFWPAMKASWTMVHRHWWYVFGLTIVVGLVGMAGLLGCCIGVIVTIPIGMCAVMIAYETIFGPRQK